MNNTVYDVDFTRALPAPLRNDEAMLALGRVIAGELQENIKLARYAVIYARIDELEEDILDILARDLHVDWYEDSYPVETKREVIKNSVKVHKRLGTKYAILTALGSVFPNTEVEEWFEYGGEPFYFRIVLDMTGTRVPADYPQIIRTAAFYKRLTAHLEEVIYQTSAVIEIRIEATAYKYGQGMTGRYHTGTRPHRNVKGGVAGPGIEIATTGEQYGFHSPPTGTKPVRNINFINHNNDVSAHTTAEAFLYAVNMTGKTTAGTTPHISTDGQISGGGIFPLITTEAFSYHVKRCGMSRTKNK